jgi:large subunit ribosomal protein L10
MPKSKAQKQEELAIVQSKVNASQGVVFTADQGLTVKDSEDLRKKLRAEQAGLQGIKKTLLLKALAEAKVENADIQGTGNVAVAFSETDAVAPARIIQSIAKSNDKLVILGGLLDGMFISKEKVIALAKLPSCQELLAQTVGTLQAPITGFVRVMAGNIRGLVTVLNAVKEKKV